MSYFPKGFYFGTATAAYQVEGGITNDWSEWEKTSAKVKVQSAKLKKWPDHILALHPSPLEEENYICGRAVDHYHRFEEDFDIAKRLGHNAHRFSIEWARIEPEEGKFNENEIEHYRNVISALRERGIEPFVTLWHWTNPVWIRDIGGWENPKTTQYFSNYVEKVVRELRTEVKFWMPMNEPNTYIGLSYVTGIHPPQVRNLFRANRVFRNLMRAYRQAYRVIHEIQPNVLVGVSHYAVYMIPYKYLPWNALLIPVLDYIRNWRFLHSIRGAFDFIGLQYYHTDFINLKIGKGRWGLVDTKNPNEWVNDIGWQVYPEGIYYLLKRSARYKRPIYITENGVADARDVHRERFIREHLKWVLRAIEDGVDVRGYLYWSLLDNFEWHYGFWPKFGLVEVNRQTMERRIRPSAFAYKRMIGDFSTRPAKRGKLEE